MESEFWTQVLTLLEQQEDQGALRDVMNVLLTPEERESIGSRLAIMRALIAGEESQREIAARVEVSIAKVTRCSNYLKRLSEADKALIEQGAVCR